MDIEKVKDHLSSILYAEHMGDVQRALFPLARELGLPEPVFTSDETWEREYVWPWDADE